LGFQLTGWILLTFDHTDDPGCILSLFIFLMLVVNVLKF
jgi:hypothetical protein